MPVCGSYAKSPFLGSLEGVQILARILDLPVCLGTSMEAGTATPQTYGTGGCLAHQERFGHKSDLDIDEFYRLCEPVLHRKDHSITLPERDHFRSRLHARTLLGEHELATQSCPGADNKIVT